MSSANNYFGPNTIETLNLEDIDNLLSYLNNIRQDKIQQQKQQQKQPQRQHSIQQANPKTTKIEYDPYEANTRNGIATRAVKRSQLPHPSRPIEHPVGINKNPSDPTMNINHVSDYHNPYEYGSRQNIMLPTYYQNFDNNLYQSNENKKNNDLPTIIDTSQPKKNISLLSRHFDDNFMNSPKIQNENPIVWADNMPRGGYSTRTDKLDM